MGLKNKNKIINNEDEMDQKLDPEAPAYIPNIATSPWSSSSSLVNVAGIEFVQLLQSQTLKVNKLQPVPEENGEDDSNSNASTQSTTTQQNVNRNQYNMNININGINNGYITTNVIQSNQLLHTPKDFNHPSPQTNQPLPPQNNLNNLNMNITPFPILPNSMPELLSINPPPHPSRFQCSRSYGQLPLSPNTNNVHYTSFTPNPAGPAISAAPTLLNVADGVIPGVEAGLYWYHPQIDQSAVLLPVVVTDPHSLALSSSYYQNK